MPVNIIPEGNRLRVYYFGMNAPQGYYGREREKDIPRFEGTGLAFIGKDRFIGLQTGPEGGFLLTRQFILEGDKIEINVRSHVENPAPVLGSMITAELLQSRDEEFFGIEQRWAPNYPGFSMTESDPVIVKDEFNQVLSWNGSSDLSSLKGKPVYIRFYIRNSTLYTFRVINSDQKN